MSRDTVITSWKNNLAFEAEINGHKLVLDAANENGGTNLGPRPKPLLLASLGGCTGMDVISLLKKMRVEVESFRVIVSGDITEEHPKHFRSMHIIYEFSGKDLPIEKLTKAVELSEQKYCGVSATLKKALEITTEIRIA